MKNKYDTILYLDNIKQNILEFDTRVWNKNGIDVTDKSFVNNNPGYDDPKLYGHFSFGKILQRGLSGMGDGSFAKVTDFGKWVVVEAGYSDVRTGRIDSKTFLVVFQDTNDGMILNTANKYRSISGVDQAISYIKAACNSLKSDSNRKI